MADDPRLSISSRRSQSSTGAVSHGRGGAGNIGLDETDYVDGGLYVSETPGMTGEPYSGGRGGAGNIVKPASEGGPSPPDGGFPAHSDRMDSAPEESMIPPPKDGEGYSTGRGGAANVYPVSAPPYTQSASAANVGSYSSRDRVAKLGLAYGDPAGVGLTVGIN